MHGRGGVTILAQQTALGITLAGFKLMMKVILDILIELGVQLGLFFAVGRKWAAIRKFHQPLEGDADALAAVVTGNAGFVRYARIDDVIGHDFGLARGLNRVHHGVAGFIAFDRLVAAFIQAGIVVRNVTGSAAHAAKIAASVAALDTHMAALTIGAQVCKNCRRRLFFQLGHIGFGYLLQLGWKIVGILSHQGLGVFFVFCGTEYRCGTIRVVDVVIAVFGIISC